MAVVLDKNIEELDLSWIKLKLQDKEEGEGWTSEYTDVIVTEYRKFLYLTKTYPEEAIVPSTIVDKVWHSHILDTHAYAPDCDKIFGKFLHHFPYFGMRGEEDYNNLQNAFQKTLNLYEKHFGPANDIYWKAAGRCPNCGRR